MWLDTPWVRPSSASWFRLSGLSRKPAADDGERNDREVRLKADADATQIRTRLQSWTVL
jgi:hypothetical protein